MNEEKFTPWPWVLQGFRIYGPVGARSKHGNGRSLIGGVVGDWVDWRCSTQLKRPDDRGQFYLETMANAHLMVAAPDMFEALTKLRNEAQGFLSMADEQAHGRTNIDVLRLRINEATEALAKARGEA
jgi:hypothetical protein